MSGGGRVRAPRSKEPASVLGPLPYLSHFYATLFHSLINLLLPSLFFLTPSLCPILLLLTHILFLLVLVPHFPFPPPLPFLPPHHILPSSPYVPHPIFPALLSSSASPYFPPSSLSSSYCISFPFSTSHTPLYLGSPVSTRKKTGNGNYADLTSGPLDLSLALL